MSDVRTPFVDFHPHRIIMSLRARPRRCFYVVHLFVRILERFDSQLLGTRKHTRTPFRQDIFTSVAKATAYSFNYRNRLLPCGVVEYRRVAEGRSRDFPHGERRAKVGDDMARENHPTFSCDPLRQ